MFGARDDVSSFGLISVFTRLVSTKQHLGSLSRRFKEMLVSQSSRSMVIAVQHPLNGFIVELNIVNSPTSALASPYRLEI